jgi:type IV fimbrial biogenesis protein FimT
MLYFRTICTDRHREAGFTLIEMMIVLAIGAILLTVAVPSFVSMTKNNKLTSHVNTLVSHVHFARAEASKRGTRIILCRTADPTAASPTCGGTAYTWSKGWLVYALGDTTGRTSPYLYDSDEDTLLLLGQARAGVTIKTNNNVNNNLEFKDDGSTAESGSGFFAFCDDRGAAYGKQIEVLPTGRAQVSSTTDCTP